MVVEQVILSQEEKAKIEEAKQKKELLDKKSQQQKEKQKEEAKNEKVPPRGIKTPPKKDKMLLNRFGKKGINGVQRKKTSREENSISTEEGGTIKYSIGQGKTGQTITYKIPTSKDFNLDQSIQWAQE